MPLLPCRNPSRLYNHLGPSSVVSSSELGPTPPFPPMRMLDVLWSWALSLVCEVALRVFPLDTLGLERQAEIEVASM